MFKIVKMIWDKRAPLAIHAGKMKVAGLEVFVWEEKPTNDDEKASVFQVKSITWDDLHIDLEYTSNKVYGYLAARYPGSLDDALITLNLKLAA
jgi:hypothetical protein